MIAREGVTLTGALSVHAQNLYLVGVCVNRIGKNCSSLTHRIRSDEAVAALASAVGWRASMTYQIKCALACWIALEWVGADYAVERVDPGSESYRKINPLGMAVIERAKR